MIYNFHIGLPKTATTFWQVKVLNQIDRLAYCRYKNPVDNAAGLIEPLLKYCHTAKPTENALANVQEKFRNIEAATPHSEVLISNENISMNPMGFWRGAESRGPGQVIERLVKIRESLGNPKFRIMFGTREPTTWIASRYAESAKDVKSFNQADFDIRIEDLCSKGVLHNVTKWLKYDLVESKLITAFGRENVLFLPMENLETEPANEISKLGHFMGRDLSVLIKTLEESGGLVARQNVLRKSEDLRWQIKGSDEELSVTTQQQDGIRALFS